MQKLYDFFLDKYNHRDFVNNSQARLTLNFCLITALFSLFFAAIGIPIDFQIIAFILPILALLFIGLAWLVRKDVSLKTISFLYVLQSYIATVIISYYSGMIYSSAIPWLALIPLSANLLISRKAGVLWMTVCFITVFIFAYTQEIYFGISANYDKKYEVFLYALSYNGLSSIILLLSIFFQKSKNKNLIAIQKKNELISAINQELKNKNNEAVAQNKELSQQKEEILTQRKFIGEKNKELLVAQDELNDIIEKLTITQAALSDREAENRSIIHAIYNTELIVAEFDIDVTVLKMSPTALALLQKNKDDVIGKSYAEIGKTVNVSVENNPDFELMWHDLLKGKHHTHESTLEVNGETKWLQENFFPIQNNNDEVEKIMLISQDISQLKNQQFEIETLNSDLQETIWKTENQNKTLTSQQKEIKSINAQLKISSAKITTINQGLKTRVEERTKDLEQQNKQLAEYAFINAHLLRAPLCSILGLVQLMEIDNPLGDNMLVSHMKKSSQELHDIVNKISDAIKKGPHFNRYLQ